MAAIHADTEKMLANSRDIKAFASTMKQMEGRVRSASRTGNATAANKFLYSAAFLAIMQNIVTEAARMDTLGDALEHIANSYRETEKKLAQDQRGQGGGIKPGTIGAGIISDDERGTDKRNIWQKFWDWLTRKEPDKTDTTTLKQEKAADMAMKQELYRVLQDEKYSQENWDRLSVEERKELLQEYMNEVIRIYGLQDVDTQIIWDENATYEKNRITWGYYSPDNKNVTLNARALTDRYSSWDSYDLLETVAHELRHAYQHEAVEHPTRFMVSTETLDTWSYNFDHYINGDTDFDAYRAQPIEVDARDFQVTRDDKRFS